MRLLYTNNKISVMSDNKLKEFDTFILCDDDNEIELLKQAGCSEVSEIYNIEEMNIISKSIDEKVDYVKTKSLTIDNIITTLNTKISELENSNLNLSVLVEEYSSKFIDIQTKLEKINQIYSSIVSISETLSNKLENFDDVLMEKTNEKIEEFENSIEKTKDNAEYQLSRYNEYETRLQNILNAGKDFLKELSTESMHYAEMSKKWACNPVNILVDDKNYSSRHYAEINKNNK